MNAEVHVGHDGWLFIPGGRNEVLRFYEEPDFFADAGTRWLTLARSRLENARERHVTYRHMTVPDKLSVYPDKFGQPLSHPERAPARALPLLFAAQPDAIDLSPLLIDVLSPMQAVRDDAMLYWKTDSHWTFEGCWQAYLALCSSVGAKPNMSCLSAPHIVGDLALDLGSKLDPPVTEPYVVKMFNTGAVRTFANVLVTYKEENERHDAPGLHVGSHIVLKNETTATDPRRIVLFGDSYAEYRMHQLTGLLGETFAETHFVWSSSVDWNYVDRVGAHIVITEMAERFHNLVPSDEIDIEAFAKERLDHFLASNS